MYVFEKLLDIFQNIVPDSDLDNVTLESKIIDDLGFNSIGIFYMVLAIEREFNVTMHNVSLEKFVTVNDVVKFIEEN